MKVLLVSQGLERERVLAAISVHAPSKVIILRSHKDVTPELQEEVEAHYNHNEEEHVDATSNHILTKSHF